MNRVLILFLSSFCSLHLKFAIRNAQSAILATAMPPDCFSKIQNLKSQIENGQGALTLITCHFANGLGRSWKCMTIGLLPLPPTISHGARPPLVVHNPRQCPTFDQVLLYLLLNALTP